MEATTTRASIVIKSIPTSDILTHASITMPLSSTRSRTSIKLVPPGALSTAICLGSFSQKFENRHTEKGGNVPLTHSKLRLLQGAYQGRRFPIGFRGAPPFGLR